MKKHKQKNRDSVQKSAETVPGVSTSTVETTPSKPVIKKQPFLCMKVPMIGGEREQENILNAMHQNGYEFLYILPIVGNEAILAFRLIR